MWASQGLQLFQSADNGTSYIEVGKISGGVIQHIAKFNRLLSRLTRSGFQALLPLKDGSCLATIRGHILKKKANSNIFESVFNILRGSRPLNLCLSPNGNIYWGEYFFNSEKESVHIYGSDDNGDTWHIVHTFQPTEIRHVHGMFYDKFRDGLWILTGDSDKESQIIFADTNCSSLETVFSGSQNTRAVFVLPTKNTLIIGGDSPHQKNHIQILDPNKATSEKVLELRGSAFFGCNVGQWKIISVASEASRINTDPFAYLLASNDGERWNEICKAKRDIWHIPYNPIIPDHISELPFFQHPAFVLPSSDSQKSTLHAYGQSLVNYDNKMLSWDLSVNNISVRRH